MKRLLLGLALLVLLVTPVFGFSLTFQNAGDFSEYVSCSGSASYSYDCSWYDDANGGNSYINSYGSWGTAGIINKDAEPTTYAAISVPYWYGSGGGSGCTVQEYVQLQDATHAVLYTGLLYGMPGCGTFERYNHRYEVKMIGGSAHIYDNGVEILVSGTLAQNPSYIKFYATTGYGTWHVHYDDFVYGTTENQNIFDAPKEGFYLKKDLVNPALTGLYNSAGTLVSSYNVTTAWGKSSITPETLALQNFVTGVSVATVSTGTTNMGSRAWPISDDIFNNPLATHGYYVVTIPGTNEFSQVIPYIGDGATVTFNAAQYSVGDTATIDYTIIGGGYWDTSTYTYKMVIQDVYWNVVSTQTISTQAGTKSYTFTDSDSTGVYNAIVMRTPIAGGSDAWMQLDTSELSAYVTITGWINNADTGLPIAGSKINITQDTQYNFITTVDGNYSTTTGTPFLTGSTLSLNATATGFDQYLFSFTPLTGSAKAINITLVPESPSTTGIGLGGVCRDTVYGRPISSCNVAITNSTYGESYLATANSVGYYLLDEADGAFLTNGRWYSVMGSKTGYGNSAAYLKQVFSA